MSVPQQEVWFGSFMCVLVSQWCAVLQGRTCRWEALAAGWCVRRSQQRRRPFSSLSSSGNIQGLSLWLFWSSRHWLQEKKKCQQLKAKCAHRGTNETLRTSSSSSSSSAASTFSLEISLSAAMRAATNPCSASAAFWPGIGGKPARPQVCFMTSTSPHPNGKTHSP